MGVRSASEIPHPYERDVTYIVEEKQEDKGWVVLFRTKDAMEALQVMGDAYKQNPTRNYRTLSQEVFAKGKEPIRDGERRPTPRAEEERAHEDGEDKSADGGG